MSYRVREIFDTLQGEGARAGTRAVFVRLAACNLWNGLPAGRDKGAGSCAAWCDTDFFHGDPLEAFEVVDRCDALWPKGRDERWVVVTGGEPMLQLDLPLVGAFKARGWWVAVETNGTLDPRGGQVLNLVDHVCVSPKRGGDLRRLRAHELKIVVPGVLDAPGDVSGEAPIPASRLSRHRPWTEQDIRQVERAGRWGQVYIQPQDGPDRKVNEQFAVALVRQNPRWRLSVQTHKTLGLP